MGKANKNIASISLPLPLPVLIVALNLLDNITDIDTRDIVIKTIKEGSI